MFVVNFHKIIFYRISILTTRSKDALIGIRKIAVWAQATLYNGEREMSQFRPVDYQTIFHIIAGKNNSGI